MVGKCTRIEKIEIENFKNVKYGQVVLKNNRKDYKASILGIYGQNGSGKTALIDAIKFLKLAFCGQVIPPQFADYIHVEAEYAKLKFDISMKIPEKELEYLVNYEFKIRKFLSTQQNFSEAESYKVELFDELLSFSYTDKNTKHKMVDLTNTDSKEVFSPKSKYVELVGKDKEVATNLEVVKRLALAASRSFIFSGELLSTIENKCHHTIYTDLFQMIVQYGNFELLVIDTQNNGLITLNALPVTFMYDTGDSKASGNIMFSLDEPSTIPEEAAKLIEKMILNMNKVLSQMIPGLTIDVHDFGKQVLQNGSIGHRVQLISKKNKKEIPLRYESEGIKKIISILHLLIFMYNNPSITVAIDELDFGIFEYLLGEILKIIAEKGQGQLIFTSHNLRPLETLDKSFIVFTTTNPNNRYIRLTNVKENNNLRSFYYRDIVLGGQDEVVYDPTNNYEIALALRESGKMQ